MPSVKTQAMANSAMQDEGTCKPPLKRKRPWGDVMSGFYETRIMSIATL
jgi:hypothetical protein